MPIAARLVAPELQSLTVLLFLQFGLGYRMDGHVIQNSIIGYLSVDNGYTSITRAYDR